ncbi:MAG: L-aspartate oxidase [Bdellovibrionaceae bacterium]|nr:L-aspartate oxidase [Pseudobdellovibrionaceae bacterium]MDW8190691.1 L-aspartate oxidase [Pseudobdellovibrionaceae bacterium]
MNVSSDLSKIKFMEKMVNHSHVLIVGCGLSGLSLCLKLPNKLRVTVLCKEGLMDANTAWAQGGIAAVSSDDDSFENHIRDTLIAGAGLCRTDVVEKVITQAPQRIAELKSWGVPLDPSLHLEGGHSYRRIHHVGDKTGQIIQQTLIKEAQKRSNVQILEQHILIDFILNKQVTPEVTGKTQVIGAYVLNKKYQRIETFLAHAIVVATGGMGKVYLYTSNWSGATGDGVAACFRAGCRVANLEFTQFHPTLLYHPESPNFLISEALRGEGGELLNSKGEAFMKNAHPLGSLAPRDIVARTIDLALKKSGEPCVYLNMTHLSQQTFAQKFPVIFEHLKNLNIDPSTQWIPVVPAAHYCCGGVIADLSGKTDLDGLFVIGESAYTGLHGANRLASNSLLECLVMAHECAQVLAESFSGYSGTLPKDVPVWHYPKKSDDDELVVVHHMWDEIRTLMWNYVGIVRTNKRLARAMERLKLINQEIRNYYEDCWPNADIIELRNLGLNALLIVKSALKRRESRGSHFNKDHPETLQEFAKETVLWPGDEFR